MGSPMIPVEMSSGANIPTMNIYRGLATKWNFDKMELLQNFYLHKVFKNGTSIKWNFLLKWNSCQRFVSKVELGTSIFSVIKKYKVSE